MGPREDLGPRESGATTATVDTARAPRPLSRAEKIRRDIVAAILEHRLGPGTKLGEDEIGSIYGASRTIVRSALQSLAHEGIVVIEKNRGAFVAHPTTADAGEVFDARILIEAATTRLATARADAAAVARLRAHLAQEHRAADEGDEPTAIRLSGEFHLELARIAGHHTYESFLRELVARSSLIILLYRRRRASSCNSSHHDDLVDAVEAGDGDRAVALMDHHLIEIRDELDLSERLGEPGSLAAVLTR